MEGMELPSESAADAEEYVRGDIDLTEYRRRTRARYGLPAL